MICRLCLCDLDDCRVSILSEDKKIIEYDLTKLIAKYFQLEVTIADPVSTNLCVTCWRYLRDFEEFCTMIADKQNALQLKTEPLEPAIVVWNTESPIESKLCLDIDIKDHILCEPEIDAAIHNNYTNEPEISDDDDDDFDFDASDRFELSSCKDINEVKDEEQQQQQQQQLQEIKAVSTKEQKVSKRMVKKKKLTTKVKVIARKKKSLLKPTRVSERVATINSNNNNNNASRNRQNLIEITPTPTTTTTTEATVGKGKRGRPKGSSGPRAPKIDDPDLEAKRNAIKELDDYIAANVKLDCCLCAAPLVDFIDLKRHFRVAHNSIGYVLCCNNRYKKRSLYVDHLHYHKNADYFSCKPCRKNFLSRNSREMHMLRFHSDQQKLVHQCMTCNARFAKKYLLTMHSKSHKSTDRPEICDTCGKSFCTKLALTAHVKRMHTDDFTPIVCDICGVHFRSKGNFITHKKALHPEGPVSEVQCHLCGHWLRDERNLRKHLARHDDRENNIKYRCKLCGVEKPTRVALGSHMRYHHSNKSHKCTLCGKEFKLSRALAEHMATHTGIDLYSCPFCTRTFKSHANMHNHKKKMHPNEWVRKYTQPTNRSNGEATATTTSGTTAAAAAATSTASVMELPSSSSEEDKSQSTSTGVVYDVINLSACGSGS